MALDDWLFVELRALEQALQKQGRFLVEYPFPYEGYAVFEDTVEGMPRLVPGEVVYGQFYERNTENKIEKTYDVLQFPNKI